MNITNRISVWEGNHQILFLILRVALGMILAIRGITFLNTIQPLFSVIKESRLGALNMNMPLALLISWVHTLGGTFIILGLLTRISVWAQIPIVLGAIVFIHLNNIHSSVFPDLLFTIFVLLLLILFAFAGSGNISMDSYTKKHLL